MAHLGIESVQLMERAAEAITAEIKSRWPHTTPITVFAGPGNNGGDALAVARMLALEGYAVSAYLFNVKGGLSPECTANRDRILETSLLPLVEITRDFDPPVLEPPMLVIDGLFGSGLNKPLAGGFASLVKYINQSGAPVVSIDMPSGLLTDDNTYNVGVNIIHATLTITIQTEKLAMYLEDCHAYFGEIVTVDIGLDMEYAATMDTTCETLSREQISSIIRPRPLYAHKGTMGHALLIAGSRGMAGAAVLAAKASLKAGVGKLTVHVPECNNVITQISVPEAITLIGNNSDAFIEAVDAEPYNALAIGPGIGQDENTAIALIAQLRRTACHIVCDADGLNILANHRAWMQQLPKNIILTPHSAEFDRLSGGASSGSYERLMRAVEMAERLHAYIVLKGHHTAVCTPSGHAYINTTGNPGMATAGTGDVLTGILGALLARGYHQMDACLLGVYIHGLAGDLAAAALGEESLTATDIINHIPQAFISLTRT